MNAKLTLNEQSLFGMHCPMTQLLLKALQCLSINLRVYFIVQAYYCKRMVVYINPPCMSFSLWKELLLEQN